MGRTKLSTREHLNKLALNQPMIQEIRSIKNDLQKTMDFVEQHIQTLRHADGRKVRKERLSAMVNVLRVLYDHASFCRRGECTPSMKRIAYLIDPLLKPKLLDSSRTLKSKDRALGNMMMVIQRAVVMLEDFGFIQIHTYRSATNQDPLSHANFYYELTPVSSFCPDFAIYIQRETQIMCKMQSIILGIKETVFNFEKIKAIVDGVKPPAWEFPESRFEKWYRSCGAFAYS